MSTKVLARDWYAADTSTADKAAALFGEAEPAVPEGMEHLGWTWEYADGSLGAVKIGDYTGHRSKPVRMRPVFAPLRSAR